MGLSGLQQGLGFLEGELRLLGRGHVVAEHPLEGNQQFLVGCILAGCCSILKALQDIRLPCVVGRVVDIGDQTRESIFIDSILDTFIGRLKFRSHFHDRLGGGIGEVADLGGEVGAVLGRHG